jgi:hypothetical protein
MGAADGRHQRRYSHQVLNARLFTPFSRARMCRALRFFQQALRSPRLRERGALGIRAVVKFRIAFFLPTGPTKTSFDARASRADGSLGLTVRDVDAATPASTRCGQPSQSP